MGKAISIASAVFFMTVSWIWAGNFDALAVANEGASAPMTLAKSDGAKAGQGAEARPSSRIRMETDLFMPEPVAAVGSPHEAIPTPAAAFKKRSGRGMAPPPSTQPAVREPDYAAQAKEDSGGLELDLEKDLVISPPPAKTTEGADTSGDSIEPKASPKERATEKRQEKPKESIGVKRIAPPALERHASKPIRKVRPLTQDAWSLPAGAHVRRPVAGIPERAVCEAQEGIAQSPARRYVRDGVTVKLAPAEAPPNACQAGGESGEDIISAAAEIIGLPFAFISSLF
jgi:hypothetical protein